MAKITLDHQSAFFENRPDDDSGDPCADKTSFLDNDTTISLILPYFNLKQLFHAETFNRRFRDNIIKFYFGVEDFCCMSLQETHVQGFIDKICNRSPNIKRLKVGPLYDTKPLAKLHLMKKLRSISILFNGSCTEIEFQTILISFKPIAHQLRVLDLGYRHCMGFRENDVTNRHFLNDFVSLEELHLGESCWAYLPNVALPKLLILQYSYIPNRLNLLHHFFQQNLQIEELHIRNDFGPGGTSLLFPSSSLALIQNLHVLHVYGSLSINGDLAKQFVDYNHNLSDLTMEQCKFESDEALQIIFDGLHKSLVKLELNYFSVNSVNAFRGIHKLQNLQHLKIYFPNFSIMANDSISIEDFLSLKALRFLDIHDIPITFGATSLSKFHSLDELAVCGTTKYIKLLDYCTDSLTKLTIDCLPKNNANERLIQLSTDCPNLISLCCYPYDESLIAEETARVMSHNLANLKHLNARDVFSLTSLILFFQNCKCLTNIHGDWEKIDDLKNHPVIKDARNCGRYIEIH